MAKLLSFHPFRLSGKLGDQVYYCRNGQQMVRKIPGPRKNEPTEAQLCQQAKFALLTKFLKPLKPLLDKTFNKPSVPAPGSARAFSHNYRQAVGGTYPSLSINYPQLLLSCGDLPKADSPAAAATLPGRLRFYWTDNSGCGRSMTNDKAFIAAYCEEIDQWIFMLDTAFRAAGTCTVDLKEFSGMRVHTYLGFISANGKYVSESVYVGEVAVLSTSY